MDALWSGFCSHGPIGDAKVQNNNDQGGAISKACYGSDVGKGTRMVEGFQQRRESGGCRHERNLNDGRGVGSKGVFGRSPSDYGS
ncbi:hypothetical protein SUGI_0621270 [Cryptomeria japonica]|nr:hypothetical protein SUGI_0621270 [Cryptomeria japonica]